MNKKMKIYIKRIAGVLLVFSLFSCSSGKGKVQKVELLFGPSFLYPTKFTIDVKNKTIEQYSFQNYYQVKEQIDSNSYKVHKKDTLIIHYLKSFRVENENLSAFLAQVENAGLDSTTTHQKMVLDGIGYQITSINNSNDTVCLASNLSSRSTESELEFKILDAFFELAYSSINDYDGVVGLENIQDYFSYGLPIRKSVESPLEYRIWGSLSGCRADNAELVEFLENLPASEPVIFDLRNGSISYCLSEVIDEFSQKKYIYFYGDINAVRAKRIMDEIELAEKNGEVLSALRKDTYETYKRIYNYWLEQSGSNSFLTKDEVLIAVGNK